MSEVDLNAPEQADPLALGATETDSPAVETEQHEDAAEPEAPRAKGVQKRLDELTALRRDAERERDHWRELAMRTPQPVHEQTPTPEPVAAAPTAKPAPENYATDAEFIEALTDWKVTQALGAVEQRRATETAAQQRARVEAEYNQRAAAFAEQVPDFSRKISDPTLPITGDMADVIRSRTYGPAVANYLADNRAEALRIAQLPREEVIHEMALLSQAITPVQRKPVNPVPAPITPLGGGGAGPTTDDDKLSSEQWAAKRNAEVRAKRNG